MPEKTVESIEQGLNSLRADVERFKEKVKDTNAVFQRDLVEKVVTQKYELSEQMSNMQYNCKQDAAKAIGAVNQSCSDKIESAKADLHIRVDRVKSDFVEKLDDLREESREADRETRKSTTELIRARVKAVSITSAVLVLALGWLWSYTTNTATRFDNFKDDVGKQISDFRDEIRTLLSEDIKQGMWALEAKQDRLLLLLRAHERNSQLGKDLDDLIEEDVNGNHRK